ERKEVDAGAGIGGAARGDEHDRLAARDEDRALRLLGDATGLDRDDGVADLDVLSDELVGHGALLGWASRARRGARSSVPGLEGDHPRALETKSGCSPLTRERALGKRTER